MNTGIEEHNQIQGWYLPYMRQKSALDPIIPGPNLYGSVWCDALGVQGSESKCLPEVKPRGAHF